MNPAYQHLAVSALDAGMVLSDEIVDDNGHILLAKHAILTDRMISQLVARGIDTVAVLCPATASAPAVDTEQALARIGHLFRKNDPDDADDFATGILRRYVSDYRLGREIDA